MNIKKWLEHIKNNIPVFHTVLADDHSNIKDFFCTDTVGNRSFAQNFGGWPRSEVAEINAQVSMASAENLLRDLQVFPVETHDAAMNDADIMLGHKSKYCQSPNEVQYWLEEQIQIREAKRKPVEAPQGEVINFESADEKIIDNA